MNINDLYKIAKHQNINILRTRLYDFNGCYMQCDVISTIILNRILQVREEKATLAEELGHPFMGGEPSHPFATDYYNRPTLCRNENKAIKWCAGNLVDHETKHWLK